jgi:hypothetical protein
VESTSNIIFRFVEYWIVGSSLPTNVREVCKLTVGPKLKNIAKTKNPILNWLVNQLNNWSN